MASPRPDPPTPALSLDPRLLAAAPHRLLFFAGATSVLLAMAWWAAWLLHLRWGWPGLPSSPLFAGWLHALILQYQVLPPFMFGFLLTVFPRWMGLPELQRRHYLPAGLALLGGQWATVLGAALALPALLHAGWVLTIAGWTWGLWQLGRKLLEERRAGKGPTWHAWSCFAAMVLGWIGLLMAAAWLHGADPRWVVWAIRLGTFGLLLPVYVTVAHRMFPFFAGNVVAGYRPWRPLWLLLPVWAFCLGHVLLDSLQAQAWLWCVDLPFAALCAGLLWRWWPRAPAPGLLWVLFLGFAWLPVALALFASQSLWALLQGVMPLGRGPVHALTIGFFGSVLVAMVTRVTQGHSGQLLAMPAVAWFAFAMLQLVAVMRVLAEALPDPGAWQALAACGWLLAFTPWVLRNAGIYLQPRRDGKPG